MNTTDTICLTRRLLALHNLNNWTVEINERAKRRAGQCKSKLQIIQISSWIIPLWPDLDIKDVILHEIAHALTPGQHHNRVWKIKAEEIGARPERCYNGNLPCVPFKYEATCKTCGGVARRRRMRYPRYSCSICGKNKFNEKYLLDFKTIN